ncbi:RalA-binding protein 1 [Portunus trituberculatus]|uniref:RalA-binding protein 1 n=1 Tax=Portunus trituberculatus TaxID=210409 RepID=A0A5B7EYP2_PORTR|nr:RalA-binding protein 1 [Portunus trituberculatus]
MIVQAINEMQTRQQRLLHAHHHPGARGDGRGWRGASADEIAADSEHLALLAKEALLVAEHGELLSLNHDLMRKLQAEHAEIKRLREEIQEMQTLYGYRTYSYDSSESEGSESDGESDTEEDMLNWLSMVTKANRELQEGNRSLTQRIQEEREAVIQMRVKLQEAQWKGYSHDTPITPIC